MSDIAELFARDPLSLSEQDIEGIVEHFRKCRAQFNIGNMQAGSTKPKTEKAKAIDEIADKIDIKLDF